MLASTTTLLRAAEDGGYAIGAFNVYNLEGVRAVVGAAEAERSPAMLQIHPGALTHGGTLLIGLCLAAAREASVPVAVHLDHSSSPDDIRAARAISPRWRTSSSSASTPTSTPTTPGRASSAPT